MSQSAIKDKTNLPNAPEADSSKSSSLEPPVTPTLSLGFAPAQSPHFNTDRAPGDVLDTPAEPSSPELPSPPGKPSPRFDPIESPSRTHPGVRNVGCDINPAPRLPPGAYGVRPLYPPLPQHPPAWQGAGPSQRRPNQGGTPPPRHLPPAATDDEFSSDLDAVYTAPYENIPKIPPHDKKVPISQEWWRCREWPSRRRHELFTEPRQPRLSKRENEEVRRLAADMWVEDEDQRTKYPRNAVATQEAREAGVQQRDFAPEVERPRNSRGPGIINPEGYSDPEETSMINPQESLKAMLMHQRQELQFAEYWDNGQIRRK
jgi:hypothetical protein